MRQVACLCLLLALAVIVNAGLVPSNRKMLTVNGQQAAQAPQNTQQRYYGNGRNYNDQGYAQLAANERAIVNTQYAIQDAVLSGANPVVTGGAAYYGNDQAYAATQAKRCGWYNRFGPCLGGKK